MLVLVSGDVGPSLEIELVRHGRPWPLAGAAAIVGRIQREGRASVDRALVVLDADAGLVRLDFQPGDLVEAPDGTTADYALEVTVDGETAPEPLRWRVRPRLADLEPAVP